MAHVTVISTGIVGLDHVLHGGLPQGTTIVLEGSPGSGKTTLGLQYLYNGATEYQEPGIYVTFEEMPSQLYTDMLSFGWDLQALERQNLLRVICMSPEMFMEHLIQPDGLFERMFAELHCKRIVIDSINLLTLGIDGEHQRRKLIYKLRNVLRKKGLTALILREQSNMTHNEHPFEHFVTDGVIRLTIRSRYERYRERLLEILKLRGKKFIEGEHVYRITDAGIHLLPCISVQPSQENDNLKRTSTGIPRLDDALFGGIPNGSVFMFDTNSKAHTQHLITSIISQRIKGGAKGILLTSNLRTLYDLVKIYALHGVDVEKYVSKKCLYFIDHYNRPCPESLNEAVLNVANLDDSEFKEHVRKALSPTVAEGLKQGEEWFTYYDMNTILSERGEQFVTSYFAEQAANARAYGISLFVVCNFQEIDPKISSFLERSCDGVIRTWVDKTYQYLQVTKSPSGKASEIFIVENIQEEPFVRLV